MADLNGSEIEQAAIIAHQIKSPISTVQTILKTLLGGYTGGLNDKQRSILQSADAKCSEAIETTRAMLYLAEVARRGAGDQVADIVAITRRACERYRTEAAEKNIDFKAELGFEEAYVACSEQWLLQVITALIDNAVKYTPEEGCVSLEVTVDLKGKQVRLTVADSGIGIPENERGSLFELFFRASNARELIPRGTGLGLSFVRAVVKAAGGSIAAEESALGGAQFSIVLPLQSHPEYNGEPAAPTKKEPSQRVVVIGGVAAGPKIAAKIMRLDPRAEVTVVEKGRLLSYAGCGLPYYISGVVRDQRELASTTEGVLRGPEYFERVKNVKVINRTEALEIDRSRKRVLVHDLVKDEDRWLPYDKVAIATGAVPVLPDIPGVHLKSVYTLHGLENAEGIKSDLAEKRAKDIVIVVGGLRGVEMAESFVSAGCRVTLMETHRQLLPNILDYEMADLMRWYFETKGVRIVFNSRVTCFEGEGRLRRVQTDDGSYPADMAILALGVRPNVQLAERAGLELGEKGGIKVDKHMRTCDPNIYAAGDCVETTHLVTGRPVYIPLGSTATKQGRVAAINICGGDETFPGVAGTTICRAFGYNVARSGLTETQAREMGYEVTAAYVPGLDRAHFLPETAMIIMKLIADTKTRKLLGIQAIGPGEVAKRVDVAVTAMTAGMTVDAISELDLCYAPPYSDALDKIITACNVLKNKLNGYMVGIAATEVCRKMERGENILLLDVRTHREFGESHIEGVKHIPVSALRGRLSELPRDREIIVFSRVSLSAYEASLILRANGFQHLKVMDGGIVMWPCRKIEQ